MNVNSQGDQSEKLIITVKFVKNWPKTLLWY